MNPHPAELIIAIQLVQSLIALVLAAVLGYFHHAFRHSFLRLWALSAIALAVYLIASAISLGFYWAGPELRYLRLGFTVISMAAAYTHIVWLMLGTREAAGYQKAGRGATAILLGTAALLGIASALVVPFATDEVELRLLLRVDIRYLVTGLAFIVAGSLLWRLQRGAGYFGARLGAIGFTLYGLQMLHVLAINLAMRSGSPPVFYSSYNGLLELLFQVVFSLGIVVWLLEIQRDRVRVAHSQLEFAQRHDQVTGLPNRELLLEEISRLIKHNPSAHLAVVSLGLARFTVMQQALGWQRVERLFKIVSLRLHQAISSRCVLGRIAERDLVVVRPTRTPPEEILAWVRGLLATASQPVESEGRAIHPVFQAGISMFPKDANDPGELVHASQRALVHSGMMGREVTFYRQLELRSFEPGESELRFESELRQGLELGQFTLHYQPIVSLAENRVAGFEALVRWDHPQHGCLRPDRFLDQAAAIGLLDKLESFVLSTAIVQLARWTLIDARLSMSINLSARRFQQQDLPDEVLGLCRRHGVSTSRIIIEITESTALSDLDRARQQIEALTGAGIAVALDDFGTGYNSLANLAALPVNRMKLDRGFIEGLESSSRKQELVAAMIELGHRLDISLVAEGVETPAQWDFLAKKNCDFVQGFLVQKPAAATECRFELQCSR